MISRLDGMLSVGSTGGRDYDQEQLYRGEGFDRQPTETARRELLQRAIDVLPDLENAALVQQLAGSRPLSPDRAPIIGLVPGKDSVILATGHTTKGIHLGPITGLAVEEMVRTGRTPVSIEPFLPERFKGLDYERAVADFQAGSRDVEE